MTEIAHTKCSKCKCWRADESFLNAKGRRLKTCSYCRSRHKCTWDGCYYKSANVGNLQRHIKAVHLKIKDFDCTVCDAKFSASGDLQQHIKSVHLNIKDFECSDCDAKFSHVGNLNIHIKAVHLKIKNFECSDCDFKCLTNNHLQRHIKAVHLKIKNFECSDCDYKSASNSELKTHIKAVHLKIKDFECSDCDYKCSTNSDLQRHLKTCTGELRMSSGEYKIKKNLEEMKIKFIREYTPDGLKRLRYDFYLPDYDLYIEYDGRQHFQPVNFGGMSDEKALEAFNKQKEHDKIKSNFAKDKLLRISYTDYGNIPQLLTKFITLKTDWDGDN